MALLVLGINHRTAPVSLREKVAFGTPQLGDALRSVLALPSVREAAILSTCNRTELYCSVDVKSSRLLLDWLAEYCALNAHDLLACTYDHWDEAAAQHMMRVASGLDSLVLGEPQILGQLKASYAAGREHQTVGGELGRLFEHTFAVAKRVRTDTAIGENPVSVAYAAVSLAGHIFSELSGSRALLVGAGETCALVARHLRQAGVKQIDVANRTLITAQELSQEFGGRALLLSDMPEALHLADIVITATASPLPVIGKGMVERALRRRRHKPMFMVDLAVPRDIEPEVSELQDIYLYTVDDLHQVIDENVRSRTGAAKEAEHLVESGAAQFMYQLRARHAVSTLTQFRGHAEALRDAEIEKALKSLRAGADPELVLRGLANGLTNKLIHTPTVQLREATAEGRTEVTDWVRQLYRLRDAATRNDESA